MKGRLQKAILLGMTTLFLLTSSVYAYDGNEKCSKSGREESSESFSDEIGLTAEQEAQLKAQREEFKEKQKALMTKLRAKKKELKEELNMPEVDRSKADRIISDIQFLTGETIRNRVNKIIAMKTVLTPEQFKKLQEKMQKKYRNDKGIHRR